MKNRTDRVRTNFPSAACLIFLITIAFVLPVTLFSGQGDIPMVPITVEVTSAVPISSDLESKIAAITKDFIQKNLPEFLAKSSRVEATASISEQPPRGYVVEVLVMSLYKQTFNAHMSRIIFSYKDGQASLPRVEPNFQPNWGK